ASNVGPFRVFTVLVAAALAGLALWPLTKVLSSLLWLDGSLNAGALRSLWTERGVAKTLLNTLAHLLVSGPVALVFGSLLAWIVERTDARIGVLSELLPVVPFFMPPVAGAIGWLLLMSDRAGLLNAFLRWLLSFVGIDLRTGPFDVLSWYGIIFVYSL